MCDLCQTLHDHEPEGLGIQESLDLPATIVAINQPILSFTPHFADLLQFPFHRSAILKEHRIFVCLCIICSNGASVELL